MAHGGVVAHSSSWSPAAYELEESSPLCSELPGEEGQGDKVVYFLMGLTAGNAAGFRGGVCQRSLLSPFSLVLHFVTDSRMFWVFGSLFQRRCGVFLASCCGSGNLVLSRRCGVPVPAVVAAAIRLDLEVATWAGGPCTQALGRSQVRVCKELTDERASSWLLFK